MEVGERRAIVHGQWLVDSWPVDVLELCSPSHLSQDVFAVVGVAGGDATGHLLDSPPQ
jgi:hypothetical protein